jgi:hypothetical protein
LTLSKDRSPYRKAPFADSPLLLTSPHQVLLKIGQQKEYKYT